VFEITITYTSATGTEIGRHYYSGDTHFFTQSKPTYPIIGSVTNTGETVRKQHKVSMTSSEHRHVHYWEGDHNSGFNTLTPTQILLQNAGSPIGH